MKLNPRQRLFVLEYLKDLNGKQAAIRAGYSRKTAESQASRLLRNVKVAAEVKKGLRKVENTAVMDRQEILEELTLIGRFDLANYFDINEGGELRAKMFTEMSKGTSRALKSIKETRTIRESSDGQNTSIVTDRIEYEGHSKIDALKLLGQHEGLFPTKVEGKIELEARLTMADLKKSLKGCGDASGS